MPGAPSISSGFLTKAAELLQKVDSIGPMSEEQFVEIVDQDDIKIRDSRYQVLRLIEESGWISSDKTGIILISKGLGLDSTSTLNDIQMELLWSYMMKWNPPWSETVSRGLIATRARVSPADVKQIFEELGLLDDIEEMCESARNWWFRAKSHGFEKRRKKNEETGLEGENLSIAYEMHRTKLAPLHASIESDELGYDIESVRSEDDSEPIYIEVKTTTRARGRAKLHLTRNEYNVSKEKSDSYFFHLWILEGGVPEVAVIPGREVAIHCPQDNEKGLWSEVRIPFSVFDGWVEWNI